MNAKPNKANPLNSENNVLISFVKDKYNKII